MLTGFSFISGSKVSTLLVFFFQGVLGFSNLSLVCHGSPFLRFSSSQFFLGLRFLNLGFPSPRYILGLFFVGPGSLGLRFNQF